MEDRIRLLPENIANQIAAGEVVNRPASVVKEMMENSIDAGSTEVIVNYRKGGHELIQIVDNGVGMSPNDARMSFDRHATSKIKRAEDLYALHTFGFRGEALASIAAVARVELKSRTSDAEMGTLTIIDNGRFSDQTPILCEKGSQFCVRNLFHFLPARKRFLEKETTSSNHIKEEFRCIAISNPDKSFELYADDSPIYKLPPSSTAGRIVDVVGRNIKKNLLEIHAETVIVKISGYIGRPAAAKKSSSDQYMFVNGRIFRSSYLNKAIMRGYEKLIVPGLNPAYFLFFEVAPDKVDVNVHPQKTEVKFEDESAIWQILNAAVRESLAKTGAMPLMEFDNSSDIEIPVAQKGVSYAEPTAVSNSSYNPFEVEFEVGEAARSTFAERIDNYDERGAIEYEPITTPQRSEPKRKSGGGGGKYSALKNSVDASWENFYDIESGSNVESVTQEPEYEPLPFDTANYDEIESTTPPVVEIPDIQDVTVVGGCYAWCKIGANMSVIDLRRAKERLLYNHYITILKDRESVSQQILFPIELRLSNEEYSLMEEHAIEFSMLGLDIDYIKKGVISVKGLPADVTSDNVDRLIYDLLQLMATPEDLAEQRRDRVAKIMAKSSTHGTANHNISPQQAKELILQLLSDGDVGLSPSGKAIMWQITKEDIKKHLG
ncbi:MAG: DNA mismatch repair endonuclease MutL [Rikenellaceae bacterium]